MEDNLLYFFVIMSEFAQCGLWSMDICSINVTIVKVW